MFIIKSLVSFAKSIALSLWRRKSKKEWRLAFNLLVFSIFGIFVYSRFSHDWAKIKATLIDVNPWYLLLVIVLYGFSFCLQCYTWNQIVTVFNGPDDWHLNAFLFASSHLAKFLPTPVWFVGSRVHGYDNKGLSKKTTVIITALEVFLHFLSGLMLWILLSIDGFRYIYSIYIAILIVGVILVVKTKLLRLSLCIPELKNVNLKLRDIVIWFGVYLLTWVIAAPFFWVIVRFFYAYDTLQPIFLWRIWIFSSLVSYVSSYTLGGMGFLREMSLTWLLNKIYPISVCLFIAAGVRAFLTIGGIIWGAITYWTMRGYVRKSLSFSERS